MTEHSAVTLLLFSDKGWEVLREIVGIDNSKNIVFGSKLTDYLEKQGIQGIEAHSYLSRQDWEDIANSSVEWIKRWPYGKFSGKSLVEWLQLDGYSLWWQLEGILYYSNDRKQVEADGLYEIIKLIKIISRIIEHEKPEKVYFVDRGDQQSIAINHLLSSLNVQFEGLFIRPKQSALKDALVDLAKTGTLFWIGILWIYIRRSWRGLAYRFHNLRRGTNNCDGKVRVLLASEQGNGIRSYIDPRNGTRRNGDFYYAGIQEQLLADSQFDVSELQIKLPTIGHRPWLEDLRQIYADSEHYIPFDAFNALGSLPAILRFRGQLRQLWHILCHDSVFRASLVYNGVDLFPILHKPLKFAFLYHAPMILYRTRCYRKALHHVKPDTVVMNRHNAAMIDACQLNGIPLIELEHGIWSRFPAVLLRYYQYSDDKLHNGQKRSMPAAIAVWGTHMRDLLIRWNYPPDRIFVTGYPAYDRLHHPPNTEQVSHFAEEIGLDSARKKIVFMTGNPWMELYQTPQEQIDIARILFQTVKKLPKTQLVIKVHQYDNPDLYRQLQKELGAESYSLVIGRCDTTLLIVASDVVVAKGSSTLLEAAIADKPVIVINFSDKPDMFEFREYNIGPYINDIDILETAIKTVLFDEAIKEQLADERTKFVQQWANSADGKASERLADLILQMVKSNRCESVKDKTGS
jgi:glycosyltransferase involved in cell wall biosynthesis